ncbi:MAG: FAD-binding protein [Dehalococcoidales bacterium]|nr:FAD-binding protein [Dehalococcoidales bacterium]
MSLAKETIERLRHIVGKDDLLTSQASLLCYSYDATSIRHNPEAVALVENAREVSQILALANQEKIPVVPRGGGTGLSGGSVPAVGGIVLDLQRMNRIVEIDAANLCAVVEPGVVTADLQAEVERRGLFFPPDPSSLKSSTIGGNVAENAGGARGVKYGVTRDYVLGLEVVLADGRVLTTGGKQIKNVTGYDLTRLFVGSEGTLGVVTKAILRLLPLPKYQRSLMAVFPEIENAGTAVAQIIAKGIVPTTMEIMDNTTIRCVEEYLSLGLPVKADAILLIEVDGEPETVDKQMPVIAALARENGASEVELARDQQEADSLWRARRAVSPALGRRRPSKVGEDISVPRSAVPAMIRKIQAIAQKHDLVIAIFGHAGDGNLHPNILCDRRDEAEMRRVHAAAGDIFAAALELGGTLSGEHGIGLGKQEYLQADLGEVGVSVMRAIKLAIDPNNILNPTKVFPEDPDR